MAWNQPGNQNNNPWGKKQSSGGNDFDQQFKDWQKKVESFFGGGGGRSATPLLIIGILVVGVWMLTGFYQVKTGERGVVQRFGKHVDTVEDGLKWRLPWPIESLTKVNVQAINTTSYKSRVLTGGSGGEGSVAGAPQPESSERKSDGADVDSHAMVELQVAVQYQIKDAEDYLFKVRDPNATLNEVSESAIREVVGRNDQQAILAASRLRITETTRDIMQRALDAYGAGILVTKVNITDVQVPEAVQQSQRDSVKAEADKVRAINESQAYANGIIPQAEGRAAKIDQDAKAYKAQLIAAATGDASRFGQLLTAYEKSPGVTRERLYIEAVESVLRGSRKIIVDNKGGNGNVLYLPLDKLLERSRDQDSSGTRPSVTVEPADPVNADPRSRTER
jgi:modulator of FtsH protease HflK